MSKYRKNKDKDSQHSKKETMKGTMKGTIAALSVRSQRSKRVTAFPL